MQMKTGIKKNNMQDHWDTIKRPNLWITGIEEEEVQAKVIGNIFSKVIPENFPSLQKGMVIQV
jgi:hypothetical protein